MPRLTDVSIKSLSLPATGQITYDDENSPLKVRVSRGGARTFIVLLGSGRRHTIGRYGEVSLADAREAARRLRAQKTLGAILPCSIALEDARRDYLKAIRVRASTRTYYERHLNKLTGRRLADIDARKLNMILATHPDAARNQALASFRAFFHWCVRQHHIDINPCQRLKQTKQTSRERTLSNAELKAIWHACEDDSFGLIVRMLILTGQRKGETAALQSSWIDSRRAPDHSAECSITFPAAITKNGEEHTIPIGSSTAILLRAQLQERSACHFNNAASFTLFPSSQTGTLISGWTKLKAALDTRCKVSDWTLHDLRRTFSTIHAKIGTPPHVTEALLNHKTGTLTPIAKIYNRYRWEKEMREAMNTYDAHISRVISAADDS